MKFKTFFVSLIAITMLSGCVTGGVPGASALIGGSGSGQTASQAATAMQRNLKAATENFYSAATVIVGAVANKVESEKLKSSIKDSAAGLNSGKNTASATINNSQKDIDNLGKQQVNWASLGKEKATTAFVHVVKAVYLDKKVIDNGEAIVKNASVTDLADPAVKGAVDTFNNVRKALPSHIDYGSSWISGLSNYLSTQGVNTADLQKKVEADAEKQSTCSNDCGGF